tara:strand:+ start:158 stop:496 length:339 start_codon:yes stop_codon:yes gene_type:complete
MENIKLDVNSWKIKAVERSRGRMKLQIKLNKEQAEAFKNFSETLKPEDATDEQWYQMIFFTGCERINEKVYEMAQEYAEEKAAELEASGITIIEDEEGLTVESVDDSDPSEA